MFLDHNTHTHTHTHTHTQRDTHAKQDSLKGNGQPALEATTYKNQYTWDENLCLRWDSNPRAQQGSGCIPTNEIARPTGLAVGNITLAVGNITLAVGNITLAVGNITLAVGNITLAVGNITFPWLTDVH